MINRHDSRYHRCNDFCPLKIKDHDFKGKHWVIVQFLSINQRCSLLGDSILCDIYILLKLDCVVKAASILLI